MQIFYKVMLVLTIIGGINWGLIGILDFNLVEAIFGEGNMLIKLIYSLVGIASVICIAILFKKIDESE